MPKDPSGSGKRPGKAASTSATRPTAASPLRRADKKKGRGKNDAGSSPGRRQPDGDSDVDFELTLDSLSRVASGGQAR